MFNSFQKETLLQKEIKSLKNTILSGNTLLKKESILVFTCGKSPNPGNPGGRDLLLNYAKEYLPKYHFFIAEKFFEALTESEPDGSKVKLSDLLKIEEDLTKYSDCIIIILESNSAIAELGAFTIIDDLAESVMVINDVEFKDSDSFISLGPLKKVDEKSNFGPVIYTKLESISRSFAVVKERLDNIKRGKNKRVLFDNATKLKEVAGKNGNEKNRLLFVADLISLFSPISFNEMIVLMKKIYGGNQYNFLHDEIRLLMALDLVKFKKGFYYRTKKDSNLFFDFKGFDTRKLRSVVLNHFFKYKRDRFKLLNSKIQVA